MDGEKKKKLCNRMSAEQVGRPTRRTICLVVRSNFQVCSAGWPAEKTGQLTGRLAWRSPANLLGRIEHMYEDNMAVLSLANSAAALQLTRDPAANHVLLSVVSEAVPTHRTLRTKSAAQTVLGGRVSTEQPSERL
jgi:hypothetical protein